MALHEIVRGALRCDIVRDEALAGGCVGDVRKITLADGRVFAAKRGDGASEALMLEGFMLDYLAENTALPVPRVVLAERAILVLEFIETHGNLTDRAQTDAADHIAALHAITAPMFGFACDTVIGGLPQPNAQSHSWISFFRDQRLMHMGREAMNIGRLPASVFARLEKLCARLERWIAESATPSLVHGDLWDGNILCHDEKIAAFIDPALYYADPEIELAFATLFGTVSDAFFARYREHRPIAPGFFEERRDLYNIYPLLVHARLFGGSYVTQLDTMLRKFGV